MKHTAARCVLSLLIAAGAFNAVAGHMLGPNGGHSTPPLTPTFPVASWNYMLALFGL